MGQNGLSRVPVLGLNSRSAAEPKIRQTSVSLEDDSAKVALSGDEQSDRLSPWSKLLSRFRRPKRIPLPRTDLTDRRTSSEQSGLDEADLGGF